MPRDVRDHHLVVNHGRNRRFLLLPITSSLVKVPRPLGLLPTASPSAVPAVRWSVTSSRLEIRDQGIPGGRHTSTARVSSSRRWTALDTARCPGSTRYSLRCRACDAESVLLCLVLRAARQDGGDEEARTPDLLLAKEMLFQLSYVPLAAVGRVWWAFLDSNQRPLPYQGSALTS